MKPVIWRTFMFMWSVNASSVLISFYCTLSSS